MRRIFLRQMTHDDLTKLVGERPPKVKKPLTDLQAFGVVMSIVVGLAATGLGAFAFLAWIAWGDHTFGPRDLRYLFFIRGTLTERVGVIDAEPGSLSYRGQGRDGTASGYIRASYTSAVDGNMLLARFAERCKAVGLKHVEVSAQPLPDGGRAMTCGRSADDEYSLGIRVGATTPTEVVMAEDVED
jgi:hypothetical protein